MEELKKIWQKYKKGIIVFGLITIVIVPFIIHVTYKIPALCTFFIAEWSPGDMLGFYGAILGGTCTVIGVFLSIQYAQKNYRDDLEHKVLPYIALTTLETENNVDFFHLVEKLEDKQEEDIKYKEYILEKVYFVIKNKEVVIQKELSDEQQILLENGGYQRKPINNDNGYIPQKLRIVSIPIILENVGNGAAIDFRIGLHPSDLKKEEIKYTVPKHLKLGTTFYVNIYFENLDVYTEKETFVFRIYYENIYGQSYIQEYPIDISDKPTEFHLDGKQKKYFVNDI